MDFSEKWGKKLGSLTVSDINKNVEKEELLSDFEKEAADTLF